MLARGLALLPEDGGTQARPVPPEVGTVGSTSSALKLVRNAHFPAPAEAEAEGGVRWQAELIADQVGLGVLGTRRWPWKRVQKQQ